jgi:Transglycosylase-like domain
MPAAPRHAKPKTPVIRLRAPVLAPAGMPAMAVATHAKPRAPVIRLRTSVVAPVVAAAALASVAAAFVSLHGESAAAPSSHDAMAVTNAGVVFTGDRVTTVVRSDAAAAKASTAARLTAQRARRARHARQLAAQHQAQPAAAPAPSAAPPPPSTGGGDPAHSALGICVRNAEEGGSYAWGPGNGGGAYQFLLSTWEAYGGAASEFGVAGPAYQDQIFDNAVNAGGASNWTAYDGC